MRRFIELFEALDATTSTVAKREAMVRYFKESTSADVAWALFFLTGQRLTRFLSSSKLKTWLLETLQLPLWLFEECYVAVGDTAEVISLLLDTPLEGGFFLEKSLSEVMEERVLPLGKMAEDEQRERILEIWRNSTSSEVLVLNKLLTGGFRIGVSKSLTEKALSDWLLIPAPIISHRLMGRWAPTADFVEKLGRPSDGSHDESQPYPFYLASPLEGEVTELGEIKDWCLEWKWDGIRCQVIKQNDVFLWSRGEESLMEQFPELLSAASHLPKGTVLDGEIVGWKDGKVMPFSSLQKRISRKKFTAKFITEVPIKFIAFDCLEINGEDIREQPLSERRKHIEALAKESSLISLSEDLQLSSWIEAAKKRETSRETFVEGLMLKRLSSPYRTGRKRGDWWKWKINPLTVDAVLIYAQAGHGKRANLFTDYTFAVWSDDQLLPVAKAYSGLDDEEINELDRWIRSHTKEKFGPVRSVTPHYVFEIAFEGIAASNRHKAGVALRFPRILRWRHDKKMEEANSLNDLKKLLP